MTPADTNPLREALRPFADFADPRNKIPPDTILTAGSAMARRQITMADCYAARDALTSEPGAGTVDLKQVLGFLNSIEGAGYGGMAEFEIARETVRRKSALSAPAPAGRDVLRTQLYKILNEEITPAGEFSLPVHYNNAIDRILSTVTPQKLCPWPKEEIEPGRFVDVDPEVLRRAAIGHPQYSAALEEALATPPAPGAADRAEWQPIETAPRDGTPILVCNSRHQIHAPVAVRWLDEMSNPDTGWCDAATASGDALYYNPNYFDWWQPLPAVPRAQRVTGGQS